jgi:hypothetical protein
MFLRNNIIKKIEGNLQKTKVVEINKIRSNKIYKKKEFPIPGKKRKKNPSIKKKSSMNKHSNFTHITLRKQNPK